jgi:endoglucanase
MAKQKFNLKRFTTSKKILIIAAIAFSLIISIVGLRIVSAMVQPEYKDTGATQKQSNMKDSVEAKNAEAAVKAEAKAKVAEEKKQEASAKEATVAAATAAAQQAASQAQAASQIVSPAPKAKALYVDSASKVGQPSEIGSQATSVWLGNWSGNERQNVNATVSKAAAQGKIASFVMYYIQNRDCGDWSQGGATSSAAYQAWVREVAAGIGNREAIVIVEPDALGHDNCLTDQRYADLSYAVSTLAAQTRASVYLDAGNSNWVSASTMASRLSRANIAQARGFALNVSNYQTTDSSIRYGEQISSKTGKSFVIDTSRNGQGQGSDWCNPRGRGLGKKPAIVLSGKLDAYLWVKVPGESDGNCNGGPSAGTWWEDYAQELIRNAVY